MVRRCHHPPRQRPVRYFLGPAVLLLLLLAAVVAQAATHNNNGDSTTTTFSMALLHMNDHHSFLDQDSFAVPITNVTELTVEIPAGTEEVTVYYGGFPRIQSVLLQAQQAYGENLVKLHGACIGPVVSSVCTLPPPYSQFCLFVLAGDALVGSVLFSLFRGEADAAMMRLLCFDAFALGNHVRPAAVLFVHGCATSVLFGVACLNSMLMSLVHSATTTTYVGI